LLPSITDSLAITDSQAGFALTVMWAVYALLHYPAGRLSDQLSHRTVLTASLLVTATGIVSLIRVTSYWWFVVSISLVGVGAGLYFAPSRALLSDVFVSRRSAALGIQSAAGTLGSAAAGGLAIAALAVGPWQFAFPPILALLCVIVVLLQLRIDEPLVFSRVSFEFVRTGRRIFSSGSTRGALIVYVLFTFVWTGAITFLPTFLQAAKSLTALEATIGYALVFVISTVSGPLAGSLGDRWSQTHVATGGLTLGGIGLTALLVTSSTAALFGSIVVFAAGFRAFPPGDAVVPARRTG
jgi:MFS family permease